MHKTRINRTFKLLDKKVPNWIENINIETFDICYPDDCLVGQVFGRSFSLAQKTLGLEQTICNNDYIFWPSWSQHKKWTTLQTETLKALKEYIFASYMNISEFTDNLWGDRLPTEICFDLPDFKGWDCYVERDNDEYNIKIIDSSCVRVFSGQAPTLQTAAKLIGGFLREHNAS